MNTKHTSNNIHTSHITLSDANGKIMTEKNIHVTHTTINLDILMPVSSITKRRRSWIYLKERMDDWNIKYRTIAISVFGNIWIPGTSHVYEYSFRDH